MAVILTLAISLAIALTVTPLVRAGAVRLGAMKVPVDRSVHTRPVAHMGGIAMVAAVAVAVVVMGGIQNLEVRGILVGGLLVAALGVVDDLVTLPAWTKFLGQTLIALVPVAFGVEIRWISNPFGPIVYTGALGIPLTVVWIVAIVNTINLVDGLDGLASGITAIAASTILAVSLYEHEFLPAMVAAALLGASLGFLRYNWHPASIFMGDTGAMFLGYMLAGIGVVGTLKDATTFALAVPILALGIPILDTSFAILRRVVNHRPLGEADRGHLHHRLLDLGLGQQQVVLLLYMVTLVLGTTAVMISEVAWAEGVVLLVVVAVFLGWGAKRTGLMRLRGGATSKSG